MTPPSSAPSRHGLIVVDTLVGPSLTLQPDTLIEWRDGYFTRVEKTSEGLIPDGATRLPGVAIPGLIDAHVHFALDGTPDVVSTLQTLPADLIDQRIRANAALFVAAGITTVRDLGSPQGSVGRLVHNGSLPIPASPRVLAAQAISTPTGHGNFIALHAEEFSDYREIIDGLDPAIHPFLKLFASGGVITSGSDPSGIQMPNQLLRDVTAYAHDRGFRVAAHAHSHASIANCLAAGVDTIEHFSYLDEKLAEAVSDSSSVLVSTYVATHRFAHNPERKGAEPEALEKILHHDSIEASALRIASTIPEKVIAGSDSGTILNPHPTALHESGQLMVEAGFTPHDALMTMTSRSAMALGIDGGMIDVGKQADIVVCERNPAADIGALRKQTRVILAGHDVTT